MLRRVAKFVGLDSITQEDLINLCGLLGCDYIARAVGNGSAACGQILHSLKKNKGVVLQNMILNTMNGRQWGGKGGLVTEYPKQFRQACNLFKYCPVFRNNSAGVTTIVPLRSLPTANGWEPLVNAGG